MAGLSIPRKIDIFSQKMRITMAQRLLTNCEGETFSSALLVMLVVNTESYTCCKS